MSMDARKRYERLLSEGHTPKRAREIAFGNRPAKPRSYNREERDLFAHARRTDPDTSKAAAAKLTQKALSKTQQAVVDSLRVLREANCGEMVEHTGIPWETLSPRLAPMRRRGIIEWTGEKRKHKGRGPQRVYRLTEEFRP